MLSIPLYYKIYKKIKLAEVSCFIKIKKKVKRFIMLIIQKVRSLLFLIYNKYNKIFNIYYLKTAFKKIYIY
jgi:hypothetical protein